MGQQAFCGPRGFCVLESGSRQNRISQTAGSVACGLRTPPSCFQKAGQAGGCHCHWLNPTCWCNNPKVNNSSMEIQDPVYKNKNVPKSHTQTGTRWQLNRTVFSIQGRFLNGAPHTPPHYHSPALFTGVAVLSPQGHPASPGCIRLQGSALLCPVT